MSTEQQNRSDGPDTITTVTLPEDEDRNTLVNYYYQMLLVRRFEEKAGEMYNRARIGG
jgi:pyruvate dehydrogenase E1 component alpha subunit